ncbi:MAG: endolytic transglycosylase MltG [Clostridia bacterium]|nr:endolytic transglycosylase MltG [Clostridia bacterium]
MAKKKKRSAAFSERELHERRRYGFFWYDWLWKLLRPVMVFAASFVIVCGLVYTGYQKIDNLFFAPMDAADAQTVEFEVASGSSLSTVSRNLESAGLIHNHTVFKYMADFMGMGQKIQSGDYELSRSMSAMDILDQLISGDGKPLTTKITIIPGWTVEDVAAYLTEQDILDTEEEFLSLCRTGESYSGYYFIEEMMKTANFDKRLYALEGYLSPNTYEIYTSSSADTIIKRLLSQTEAAYSLAYDERAQEMGMTMDQVFTLASMIEKEAKTADFAKVSAVFHNRLKKGMTLGSDVTVKYVSGSEKMVLSGSDLDVNSLYNTYLHKGLPLGPICNPSMGAVVAALYPDEQYLAQKYLYFCSTDPDSGELCFTKTLQEHEAAVAMYRPLWEEYDRRRGLSN